MDPLTWPGHRLDQTAPVDAAGQSQAELLDLLVWAAGAGVAPVGDLELLWDQIAAAGTSGQAQLAADLGVDERTLRRRRRRTVRSLRDSSSAYLTAVA